MIARMDRDQLAQYLAEELGEAWPGELLKHYGLENVRRTLTGLVIVYGHGLRKGKFDKPAGFLRWNLDNEQPVAGVELNGRRRWFADQDEDAAPQHYRQYFRR